MLLALCSPVHSRHFVPPAVCLNHPRRSAARASAAMRPTCAVPGLQLAAPPPPAALPDTCCVVPELELLAAAALLGAAAALAAGATWPCGSGLDSTLIRVESTLVTHVIRDSGLRADLKPENILIRSYSRCLVKVIDMGSSCFTTDHLSSYVQSRSYRAPEVILGIPYCQKIDIWSLGCILAELLSGSVLLQVLAMFAACSAPPPTPPDPQLHPDQAVLRRCPPALVRLSSCGSRLCC